MKKIIIITLLSIANTLAVTAQDFNSFAIANLKLFGNDNSYNNTPPFELLYIKSKNQNNGIRYGFNVIHTPYSIYLKPSYKIGDTVFSEYKYISAVIPRFSVGKEWYKHLHKDVKIYAGLDATLGAMRNSEQLNNSKVYLNGSETNSSSTNKYVTNFSVGVRPFIGIRTFWKRFIVGYQASLPSQLLKQNNTFIDLDIQQQIHFGYAFNTRKKRIGN